MGLFIGTKSEKVVILGFSSGTKCEKMFFGYLYRCKNLIFGHKKFLENFGAAYGTWYYLRLKQKKT
jgi:hypothetical protein